jgi:CRISPR-associated protein Csd2
MSESLPLQQRHDFVLFFDVTNGNPNGDPDAGNMPRFDPETGRGLVTDVCLKRKIRNWVELRREGQHRFRIYVTEGAVLNEKHREAFLVERSDDKTVRTAAKLSPKSDDEALRIRKFMCDNFFDIRTFGGVLSTGINCGQVRGPVQLAFAESVEPILPLEISITRMAVTSEKELTDGDDEKRGDKRTMGRKHIIPYGLYRLHGYVSASLAAHPIKGTGFTTTDLDLLFEALDQNMFEHDRSAARGEMNKRALYIFRHQSALGNAPSHELFKRIETLRVHKGVTYSISADATESLPPARSFEDYKIVVDENNLPAGVELVQR